MFRSNKQLLFIKNETSYAASTSLYSSNFCEAQDFELTPFEAEIIERNPLRQYLGHHKPAIGRKYIRCKFTMELASKGRIANPACHNALLACGMYLDTSSSSYKLYKPANDPDSSICLQYHIDAIRTKITGAKGTFNITIEAGKIPKINFEFIGLYNAPTTNSPSSIDRSSYNTNAVMPSNKHNTHTMSYDNTNINAHKLVFNLNNQITQDSGINHEKIYITDRKPKIELDCEFHALTDFNPASEANNQNENELIFQHGSQSGKIVKIAANKAVITQTQYYSDNNILMQTIEMLPLPSSGNDEMLIYFK